MSLVSLHDDSRHQVVRQDRTDLTLKRQKRRFRNSYDFRPRFRERMIYDPMIWMITRVQTKSSLV